ncbi:MAG: MFS transporter [Acidimicrobiia bacterium]
MTARRAVAVLFLLNAVAYANVVPRLPAIKAELGLSNTSLGAAIAAVPVGALLSGPIAGWLVARVGSGRLATGCGVAFGLVLPCFALAPAWSALAAAFLVYGSFDSLMDVSMNAHALRVQRGWGRSIINSLHGLWSVGAVVGGIAGAAAGAAGISLELHLAVAGAVIIVTALLTRRWLLPGHDSISDDAAPSAVHATAAAGGDAPRRATHRLVLLGLVVVMAAAVEDAPASWGAVLLRTELGTSVAAAGLVYLGFQTMMTLGRLSGDRIVDRFGEVAVVRAGGLLTAASVGSGLAIGEPATIIVGFSLAGLGTAPLFPLVFHAAGDVPGVSTGHGVAAVAWMGRIGFLVAPPFVGLVGDALNLRLALVVVPVAGVVIALLAGVLGDDRAGVREAGVREAGG